MKKYYKFIFMALFGLFLFMPKDAFAKDTVIFYKADYTEVARCEHTDCSSGNFHGVDFGAIRRIRIIQDGYTIPPDMKYSYFIDFSYGYPSSTLHNLGIRIGDSSNSWLSPSWAYELKDSWFDGATGAPTHRYHINATFTTINSGNEIHAEIDLGEDVWLYNFTLYNIRLTATGSTTGDLLFNQTQEIIDSVNSNTDRIIESNKEIKEEQEKTNQKLDEAEETRKGIWETIKELPSKFLDMLIGLFIPDDMSFLDNFRESLEEKLGFIAEVPLAILDFLFNLVGAGWDSFNSITLPSIEMFGVSFWDSQEISLQPAIDIFSPYKYITDVICVVLCVNTLRKWYENFASGGGN